MSHTRSTSVSVASTSVSRRVIGQCVTTCVFCSSEVPGVADALHSSPERPEEPEQSEAETDEASGSNQPAHPGGPAQVTSL